MAALKEVQVAAALIFKDGRALLTRRKSGKFAGKWELPGGKLESGESGAQACRREIAEELNLTLGELTFLFDFHYDYPDFRLSMKVFKAELPENHVPTLTVHDAYAFADAQSIANFDWIEADHALIPQLAKVLKDIAAPSHNL